MIAVGAGRTKFATVTLKKYDFPSWRHLGWNFNLLSAQIVIEEIVSHPEYFSNDSILYSDVALIRLSSPARLSRNVQLVCLPLDEERIAQELGVNALQI